MIALAPDRSIEVSRSDRIEGPTHNTTIMVPAHLLEFWNESKDWRFVPFCRMLDAAVALHGRHLLRTHFAGGSHPCSTEYQRATTNLERLRIRISPGLWERVSAIARYHSVSRSLLIAHLVLLLLVSSISISNHGHWDPIVRYVASVPFSIRSTYHCWPHNTFRSIELKNVSLADMPGRLQSLARLWDLRPDLYPPPAWYYIRNSS
ncbi:MAG: DUF1564 family protein [Leptospirales bacterium]|nr:DUF1564 family protein [Leptospirales bacterium]